MIHIIHHRYITYETSAAAPLYARLTLERTAVVTLRTDWAYTMETASRTRPMTAGSLSRRRRGHSNDRDYNDDNDLEDGDRPAQQQRPTPARPSSQRNTRSTPRASAEAVRRISGGNRPDEDAMGTMRSEMETLKTNLRASDLAKSQAQVRRES